MSNIFLSHSHADKLFVRKLANDLKAEGHKVWLDEAEIKIGDSLIKKLQTGLYEVEYVVAIISTNSVRSPWVEKELDIAMNREIREGKVVVLPILIEKVEPLPSFLDGKLYGHFIDKKRYKQNFKSFLSGLKKPHYKPLQEHLLLKGVTIHPDLQREGVLDLLGAKIAIDDVFVDAEFAGFEGVKENQLALLPSSKGHPELPNYVYEARKKLPVEKLNKDKAYLESWYGPIIDQGNAATLQIGHLDDKVPDGKYDYMTSLAVLKSIPKLHKELLSGKLSLRKLARRMDLVIVVVTEDNKLVLARRSDIVDNDNGLWMASIGESLDPSTDLINGVPNPLAATRRCLHEHDELNMLEADIAKARLTVLGIATEWQYLYANLVVLVELDIDFGKVRERATDGEHTHIESVNFTAQACLPIIELGMYESTTPGLSAPIVPVSRVALLMSLISRFKYDYVINKI